MLLRVLSLTLQSETVVSDQVLFLIPFFVLNPSNLGYWLFWIHIISYNQLFVVTINSLNSFYLLLQQHVLLETYFMCKTTPEQIFNNLFKVASDRYHHVQCYFYCTMYFFFFFFTLLTLFLELSLCTLVLYNDPISLQGSIKFIGYHFHVLSCLISSAQGDSDTFLRFEGKTYKMLLALHSRQESVSLNHTCYRKSAV